MKHISEIIEDILVEWAYRVHDGMPNPKNTLHIVELRESMEELNIPNDVIYKVEQTRGAPDILKELFIPKSILAEGVGIMNFLQECFANMHLLYH